MTERAALLDLESAIRHALLAPTFKAHTDEIKAALKQLDESRSTSRAAGTPTTSAPTAPTKEGV